MDIVKNLSGPWSSVAGLLTQGSIHNVEKIWTSAGMEEPQKARLVVSPLFMRKTDLESLHESLVKLHDISSQDKSEWVQMLSIAVDGYDGRIHTDKVMEEMPMVRSSVERVKELASGIDTSLFRPLEEKYLTDRVLTSLGLDSVVAQREADKKEHAKAHAHFKIREKSVAGAQQHVVPKVQKPSVQGTDGFGSLSRKRPIDMMPSGAKRSRPDTSSLFLKPSKPKTVGKVAPKKKAAVLDISALEMARKANEERREKLQKQKVEEKELEAKARAEALEAARKAKEERKQILKDAAKRKKEELKQKALEEKQKAQEERKKAIQEKKIQREEERKNKKKEKQLKEAISSMDVALALERARMKSDVESTKEIDNPSAFDTN